MNTEVSAPDRRVLSRYGAEDRERLIKEHAASGLTKKVFCEERGINLGTFYGWSKRRRKVVALEPSPGFSEVPLPPCSAAEVEVLLPNGCRVGIRHQGQRDELVALIRGVTAYRQERPRC